MNLVVPDMSLNMMKLPLLRFMAVRPRTNQAKETASRAPRRIPEARPTNLGWRRCQTMEQYARRRRASSWKGIAG